MVLDNEQLGKEMWELNYTIGAIEQEGDILEEINKELESGCDLESVLDNFGIFHARVRD